MLFPFLVAEIRVLRSAGEDQRIVGKCAEVRDDLVFLQVNGEHFSLQNANVFMLRENAANGGSNLGGAQAGGRHLIQQRLEQVVVPPIDQRDIDVRRGAQLLGGVQSAEAPADDDDFVHGDECIQFSRPRAIIGRLVVSRDTFRGGKWYIVGRGHRPPFDCRKAIALCLNLRGAGCHVGSQMGA